MHATLLGFLALAIVGGAGFIWFSAAMRVQIPKNRFGFLVVMLSGALLGVIALSEGPGWLGGIPAFLATLGGGLYGLTVVIGGQKVASGAIRVGATIPSFSAPDENGESFESSSLAGHPVLIKFFRAHW